MRRLIVHPGAQCEAEDGIRFYRRRAHNLAIHFFDAVEKAKLEVCEHPLRFSFIGEPVRKHRVANFPYAVLYVVDPEIIYIVAFAHFSRMPGYWHERLQDPPTTS